MKQRFSSLDVKVIAHELSQTLPSLRVSNIYDLSSRIFLLKFAKPSHREQLLVDSGFRCHLTSFNRTAATAPSAFVSRLRKYLKSRRVTSVSQIGTDRVIEIIFSDGQYRLFLEFFAAGNIVLTDAELNVLALLRQVSEGDEDVDVRLGGKYVLEAKQNFHGVSSPEKERIRDVLEKAVARTKAANEIGGKKAKRSKGGDDLRKALGARFPEYPPHLLDHVFKKAGINQEVKAEDVLKSDELMQQTIAALDDAFGILGSLETGQAKGYIIAKTKVNYEGGNDPTTNLGEEPSRDSLLYDDFHPFRPFQFDNKPQTYILEYDGFNKTVDEFYSSIESQKLESKLTEREEAAKKKLQTAKNEHEKRVGALQQVQELHIRKAQAVETNTHRVEEACAAVNGLIGQGMDWVDIGKLIESEQTRGNVVAQMIRLPLKLDENTVTLLLGEPGAEDVGSDDGDETDESVDSDDEKPSSKKIQPAIKDSRLTIDIDLALTPWANARNYYDQKKTAAVKEQKTIQASTRALKSTEKKIDADLKKGLKQEKAALRPARKQFWYEKFLYFISSDGYLVIAGKDAQQNELFYRRYLKKGDAYVHADLQGASVVIVKNTPATPDAPIPPSTLSQAGALTICTSSAWDSKAVMAAWWVNSDQVSKTAPNGEYLTTGGFVIKGKKNFLPPSQLLLGFAVMWLVSEDSRANHGKHRHVGDRSQAKPSTEVGDLADETQDLTIEETKEESEQDPESRDVIVDVEDAADDAEEEIEDDNEAMDETGDLEDKTSTIESDREGERANPLQTRKAQSASKTDDEDGSEPEINVEVEDEESSESEPDEVAADKTDGMGVDETDSTNQQASPSSATAATAATSTTRQSKTQPVSRGKRNKLKRAAKKYADQDEEDRALAMELLGSNKGSEKKAVVEQDKAVREAKAAADKERRKAQHNRAAEAEKRRQERLNNSAEAGTTNTESVDAIDEEIDASQFALEHEEHLNIDLLVPQPEPGDTIIAAIPIVAPWSALSRNKYKVKLQPGTLKKGKAIREIVGGWTSLTTKGPKVVDESSQDKERVWAREIELLKAWRVEEVVGCLPVKGVRIVQGGGFAGASGAKISGNSAKGGSGKGGSAGRGGGGGKKGR